MSYIRQKIIAGLQGRGCAAIAAMPATPRSSADPDSSSTGPAFSPLYKQIKALLTQSLQGGEWRPGESIPSEMELALRFRVSQGTVRKAIDELASDNLVVRRQGKGTFVATHAEQKTQYRFLRLTPDGGQGPSLSRQLLECKRLRAPAEVARELALRTSDPVLRIKRLLKADGRPVVLDEIWLPGRLFKGLTADHLSTYRGPMYGLFETEFGVHMTRAEEKIRAVAADADSAALMHVPLGSPLLSVERLSHTYHDQPVELRRGLYDTQGHYYRNELN